MKAYKLTAYESSGKLIVEDTFEAESDEQAKEMGHALLKEKNLLGQTHRLASPTGKLLLFHS
ncbi:YhzD family protein [Sporosarcina sp. HYO08]|uniref:YhzD family protein n=1 Tax=Sporosarcina sp. HYO08 TaxID=1759557 RepID=UPI0007984DF4|nr:YhzD family protein [Sporosarcina sp. HYO08]KXH79302.1 hypothetical protein AU377_12030 [Sporosarcina sp. HYO08]